MASLNFSCAMNLSLIAALYGISSSQVHAMPLVIPENYVTVNVSVGDRGDGNSGLVGSFSSGTTLPQSTSYSHTFSGFIGDPRGPLFDAGNFSTSGSASVSAGGQLRAYSEISGLVAGDRVVSINSQAHYSDALFVSGPLSPDSIIFHLAFHGTGQGLNGGSGWFGNATAFGPGGGLGRLDLTAISIDPITGREHGGTSISQTWHVGDGTTQFVDVAVPWSFAFEDRALVFGLELIAFGRVGTESSDVEVSLISDFSNTAFITGVAVLDAQGRDISSQMDVTFARQMPTDTVPEPGSIALVGIAFAGLIAIRRRDAC